MGQGKIMAQEMDVQVGKGREVLNEKSADQDLNKTTTMNHQYRHVWEMVTIIEIEDMMIEAVTTAMMMEEMVADDTMIGEVVIGSTMIEEEGVMEIPDVVVVADSTNMTLLYLWLSTVKVLVERRSA